MEAKLASSAWQVVRAKNHRERRRTTMRKKTIFGIPGRLSFSPPLSYSLQCSPLSSSLFRVASLSLFGCCVCLSWTGHTMLIVAFVAGCLFTCLASVVAAVLLLLLLLLLSCWCCCRCVVAGVAGVLCGVCNAIKVSLHIYLAISFVIIFDISNVFLPLCVSFKWSPQTHTHTDTH